MKKITNSRSKEWLAALTALSVLLAGCNKNSSEQSSEPVETAVSVQMTEPISDPSLSSQVDEPASFESELNLELTEFSDSDLDISFDDSSVQLTLSGSTVVANPTDAVEINGSEIVITKPDTYVFSGTLNDGRIVVNLPEESTEKVHLVFNNVNITSKDCAPLAILNADKTILTVAEDTVNTLSDTSDYLHFYSEDGSEPNACLYAKDDLTINGPGTLTVNGNYNNGIYCKNDLKLLAYTLNVKSQNNAVRGDDSVTVSQCALNIDANGDGIRTETIDTEGKGNIRIEESILFLDTGQDGIDAAVSCEIMESDVMLQSGGGPENAQPHIENDRPPMRGRDMEPVAEAPAEDETIVSTKGIKAESGIVLQNCSLQIKSSDDSIHSNGRVDVGGTSYLELYAGDDGIHADDTVRLIEECVVTIPECYEGIEAANIEIAGGTTHITADDDGLNAAGKMQETVTSDSQPADERRMPIGFGGTGNLTISGGITFINAEGDGIDSNGDITITGGTTVVCGPTSDMNGALDCGEQSTIQITGGILMALGSTGMMEAPEENYIGTKELNAKAGTLIVVTDDNINRVLAVFETPKDAAGLIFSANGMKDGYHVFTGGTFGASLNEDGWATEGSYNPGTEVASGSGGIIGMGDVGRPEGDFDPGKKPEDGDFHGQVPPDMPKEDFDPNNKPPKDAPHTATES